MKLYDQREASRLGGLTVRQIRHLARLGLIPHQQQAGGQLCFDFQGLVAIRAIKKLKARGVSLAQIKRCVEHVKRRRPDLQYPLAQVRISGTRQHLVISQGERSVTPEGQLVLDFQEPAGAPRALPVDTASLFLQALAWEQKEEWERARRKYTAILTVNPEDPDVLVNLGNILYRLGFEEGAEAHYREALKTHPNHAEANFNLANVLEDRGDLANAMLLYRRALHEDPEFADACFNLARVLDKAGDRKAARVFWRRYLELEPKGEWAAEVKKRLDEG